ncbi:hypothetical protein [Ferrigenium sp. UT5]|uniref:hypothetical protein n=1 Tax=Ferrigenium sp. UT5 TaxID=3242105 RepID=UPI0038B3B258
MQFRMKVSNILPEIATLLVKCAPFADGKAQLARLEAKRVSERWQSGRQHGCEADVLR